MQCAYGGEVTLTESAPGYRLRIYNGSTISVILSRQDLEALVQRAQELLAGEEE